MPDGSEKPYWNTFYQEVRYPRLDPQDLMEVAGLQYASAQVLAQRVNTALDAGQSLRQWTSPGSSNTGRLSWTCWSRSAATSARWTNIASPLVWDFYADTLDKLAGYGAQVVRLDAFAYAPKSPGEKNFLNDPGHLELLDRVKGLADRRGLTLLPEIHSKYEEGIHQTLADKGFLTYDFFLPGPAHPCSETGDASILLGWFRRDARAKGINTVNMLGCHDGIPLLDLKTNT